jgi:hypothetical protein
MKVNGSCHCGEVSFTADVDPSRVMACHCTDCQVLSGTPYRTIVAVPIGKFHMNGSPKTYIKTAQSGNRRAQVFCPNCGAPIYAGDPDDPKVVMLRVGCIEQRAELKPSAQIWMHSALPWLDELPDVPGSSDQKAFLPPLSD